MHHATEKNADGTPRRFKVLSVKTWKRTPDKVIVSLKYGLRGFAKVDEDGLDLIKKGDGL